MAMDLWRRTLQHNPDAPALSTAGPGSSKLSTRTYGELQKQVEALAERIQQACTNGPSDTCTAERDSACRAAEAPRVIICGGSMLHALCTIACSLCGVVGVVVPVERSQAESLAQALMIHRAANAACIVLDEQFVQTLPLELQEKCGAASLHTSPTTCSYPDMRAAVPNWWHCPQSYPASHNKIKDCLPCTLQLGGSCAVRELGTHMAWILAGWQLSRM